MTLQVRIVPAPTTSVTVAGLSQGTDYEFTVWARAANGVYSTSVTSSAISIPLPSPAPAPALPPQVLVSQGRPAFQYPGSWSIPAVYGSAYAGLATDGNTAQTMFGNGTGRLSYQCAATNAVPVGSGRYTPLWEVDLGAPSGACVCSVCACVGAIG
jgi:hypothetical protein